MKNKGLLLLCVGLMASAFSVSAEIDDGFRVQAVTAFPKIEKEPVVLTAVATAPETVIMIEPYTGTDVVYIYSGKKETEGDSGKGPFPTAGIHAYGMRIDLHPPEWPPLRNVPNYLIDTKGPGDHWPGPIRWV